MPSLPRVIQSRTHLGFVLGWKKHLHRKDKRSCLGKGAERTSWVAGGVPSQSTIQNNPGPKQMGGGQPHAIVIKCCAVGAGSHVTDCGSNPGLASLKNMGACAQNPDRMETWRKKELQHDHTP